MALASVAGAVLLSAVGALVLSTPAGAYGIGPQAGENGDDGIGIQAFWFVRPDDHVAFKDIGGQCDNAKVFPDAPVRDLIPQSRLGFYLYTANGSGSCFFKESNAQYRVVVTEPSGKTLWTDINVTENGFSSRTYRVDCYGEGATLPCHGESRFVYDDHMGQACGSAPHRDRAATPTAPPMATAATTCPESRSASLTAPTGNSSTGPPTSATTAS